MRVARILALAVLLSATLVAQGGGGRGGAPTSPPAHAVAAAIPGVVAAGARIELVTFPVQSPEGPIGFPGGSGILFCERGSADRITEGGCQRRACISCARCAGGRRHESRR